MLARSGSSRLVDVFVCASTVEVGPLPLDRLVVVVPVLVVVVPSTAFPSVS